MAIVHIPKQQFQSRNSQSQEITKYPLQMNKTQCTCFSDTNGLGAMASVRVKDRFIKVMRLGVKISAVISFRARATAIQPYKDLRTFHKVPASHWTATHPIPFNPQKHTRNSVVRYQRKSLSGLVDHSPLACSEKLTDHSISPAASPFSDRGGLH